MVREITRVQAQILFRAAQGRRVPQELHDKFNNLAKKAWRVDEIQQAKIN